MANWCRPPSVWERLSVLTMVSVIGRSAGTRTRPGENPAMEMSRVCATGEVGGAGRCSSGATASTTASATITPPPASTAMILPLDRLPSGSATPYSSPGRPGGPARYHAGYGPPAGVTIGRRLYSGGAPPPGFGRAPDGESAGRRMVAAWEADYAHSGSGDRPPGDGFPEAPS